MKTILTITRNELRNLFYSPVAWFLSIVFMVLSAVLYTGTMFELARMTDIMLRQDPYLPFKATESITSWVFTDTIFGFFAQLLPHLYLFTPLITMNIVNREFNNGTIRLLYSSPLKLWHIVLGKYLSVMVFNALLVAIPAIFMFCGLVDIKSLDYGPVLSSMAGVFLLLCAFGAIGFFMSAITLYPVIAAVASFTTFFVLMNIGRFWQQYDIVRDLTWFLSLQNRVQKLILGLISSKDIIYYLVIIAMFVAFTYLRLKAGRESKPWYVQVVRYLCVITIALFAGYFSSRPGWILYKDVTARQTNTIQPKTQELLGQLNEGPLEVTLYTNLLDATVSAGIPASRNRYLSGLWEQYLRFKTDIHFRYVYYYAYDPAVNDSALYKKFPGKTLQQIAGIMAKGLRLDSALFKSIGELDSSVNLAEENYQLVMKLQYKNRSAMLRVFPYTDWPDEMNVNAAFKKLLGRRSPKVLFATGELERNIYKRGEREFQRYTTSKQMPRALVNIGFDVDTIQLASQDIPPDADILVIADPKMEFNTVVAGKIRQYISRGGNLIVYGEPGKQYVLNPVIRQTGVQLMKGQLVQANRDETPDKVKFYYTSAVYKLSEDPWFRYIRHLESHEALKDTTMIMIPGVCGIEFLQDSGFSIKPLYMTAPGKAWLKAVKLVTDSVKPAFMPLEGDKKENSFPIGVQLTRNTGGKEQRIYMLGDADLSSNISGLEDFGLTPYTWLNYNENPEFINFPYPKDNLVLLSPKKAGWERIAFIYIIPTLLLITGAIVLIRRKRK